MKSTRKSRIQQASLSGYGGRMSRLMDNWPDYATGFVAAAFFTLISTILMSASVLADPELEDYEFINADVLLRISAENHESGIHDSANNLATLFNWQQLPDEFQTSGQQRAIAISTSSAEASLTDLITGRSELAIVRADLADAFYKNKNQNNQDELAINSMRLVSTHQPEFLHVVVRSDFEGASVKALDGKRINIVGESGVAKRDFKQILTQAGCYLDSMEFTYAPVSEALQRLESGLLDAVMFFDQAPSNLVKSKLSNLDYRLLPYNEIRDGNTSSDIVDSGASYFGQALSTDFYQMPESVRSLTLATYLLTHEDVPLTSIEAVVQILDVQPQLQAQAATTQTSNNRNAIDETAAGANSPREQPYTISPRLSPIPLHPSSQVLIDIFADPASDGDNDEKSSDTRGTRGNQDQ